MLLADLDGHLVHFPHNFRRTDPGCHACKPLVHEAHDADSLRALHAHDRGLGATVHKGLHGHLVA